MARLFYLRLIALLASALVLSGCNGGDTETSVLSEDVTSSSSSGNKHVHTFSEAWEYDETDHWHPSTCGHDVVKDIEAHTYNVTTNEEDHTRTYTCKVCDYSYTRKYGDSFDVNFYNDTELLYTCKVYDGEYPTYKGRIPSREGDGSHYYEFTGWSESEGGELVELETYEITQDTDLFAQFLEKTASYKVKWLQYDGSLIYEEPYDAGSTPIYKEDTPTRDGARDGYVYKFTGWTPDIVVVTSNAEYTATFEEVSIYENLNFELNSERTGYIVTGAKEDAVNPLIIPDTYEDKPVVAIGDGAFKYTSTKNVILGDNIETIGEIAFWRSDIETITLSSSLKEIKSQAFNECNSLQSVALPDSLETIGNFAFAECESLSQVSIKTTSTLSSLGVSVFKLDSSLTSIVLPQGVTNIPNTAFQECTSLRSVNILGDGNVYYGKECFLGDSKLSILSTIRTNKTIGESSFEGCSAITSFSLSGTQSIGAKAFKGCVGLTSLSLTRSIESIGKGAFAGCSGITSISITYTGSSSTGEENLSYIFNENYDGDLIYRTDYPANLSKVTVLSGTTELKARAFCNCPATSYSLPSSLKTIGNYAFESTAATNVDLSYVTTLGEGAFRDSSVQKVTLGSSLTQIKDYTFLRCYSFANIRYKGTKAQWNALQKGTNWKTATITVECSDGTISV